MKMITSCISIVFFLAYYRWTQKMYNCSRTCHSLVKIMIIMWKYLVLISASSPWFYNAGQTTDESGTVRYPQSTRQNLKEVDRVDSEPGARSKSFKLFYFHEKLSRIFHQLWSCWTQTVFLSWASPHPIIPCSVSSSLPWQAWPIKDLKGVSDRG